MVTAGVDVKTVQIRLGHASPITTLRIFAQGSSLADPPQRTYSGRSSSRPATSGRGGARRPVPGTLGRGTPVPTKKPARHNGYGVR
jgi:hypothetical protein